MSYNEAETCYHLIDPILRDKGYNDHQRLRLETPAPVEPTGPKGWRRRGPGRTDYLRPTPMGVPLELRGRVKEIKGRKVIVETTLSAKGEVCARGEVVAVQLPEKMMAGMANP